MDFRECHSDPGDFFTGPGTGGLHRDAIVMVGVVRGPHKERCPVQAFPMPQGTRSCS
jgi:hypothetical protein